MQVGEGHCWPDLLVRLDTSCKFWYSKGVAPLPVLWQSVEVSLSNAQCQCMPSCSWYPFGESTIQLPSDNMPITPEASGSHPRLHHIISWDIAGTINDSSYALPPRIDAQSVETVAWQRLPSCLPARDCGQVLRWRVEENIPAYIYILSWLPRKVRIIDELRISLSLMLSQEFFWPWFVTVAFVPALGALLLKRRSTAWVLFVIYWPAFDKLDNTLVIMSYAHGILSINLASWSRVLL